MADENGGGRLAQRRRLIATTWRRFLQTWKPMAGWTLLVWAATTAIVTPLASVTLGRVFVGPDRVIGNDALLAFALRPRGLLYIILAAAIVATVAVVRYAGLFVMTVEDIEGRTPSVRTAVEKLVPILPALFRLCAAAVAAFLVLLAPLAAALAAIYFGMLGEHDINYYLDARPPEWRRALAIAAGLAIVWLPAAGYLVARSLPTLPAYLDGHRPLRVALARAWAHTRGRAGRILWVAPTLIGIWLVIRGLVHGAWFMAASTILEWVVDRSLSLPATVGAVAVYAGSSAAVDGVMSFFGFSFTASLVTRLYFEATDLHRAARAAANPPAVKLPDPAWLKPARLLVVGLLLVAVGGAASSGLLALLPGSREIVITAHRAGATHAPENTLLALERAIAAGADVAEIDVQRTQDGVIVVAHDADLMRTARDPRRIAAATYADLREVVIGPQDGTPADDRHLATLDEFLERSRGRITLLIELKYYGWDPVLAPQVLEHVRALGMADEVWMMSLNLDAVHQVQQMAPSMITGYLSTVAVGSPARLAVNFLGVPRRVATPHFVRDARGRGVRVHVWTINQQDAMVEVAGRGADGIITDDVVMGARFRAELESLPAAAHVLLRFHSLFLDEEEASTVDVEQ